MDKHLVLGVSGQDGSYLAEHLIDAGHAVYGTLPPTASNGDRQRAVTWPVGVRLRTFDHTDRRRLAEVLDEIRPDVVYNLAAVTAPGGRWGEPEPAGLADVTACGILRLLQAVEQLRLGCRVVHASSSAVYDPHRYGLYGVAKRFAHDVVDGYRGRVHVSNAVLYSHTSPRQDHRFLAPTIARAVAQILSGAAEKLTLSDPDGRRDWGWAPDFVRALPLIADAGPGSYDVATGVTRSAREFTDVALDVAGLRWVDVVKIRDGSRAPDEQPPKLGPVSMLGWGQETSFRTMVETMVRAEYTRLRPYERFPVAEAR